MCETNWRDIGELAGNVMRDLRVKMAEAECAGTHSRPARLETVIGTSAATRRFPTGKSPRPCSAAGVPVMVH